MAVQGASESEVSIEKLGFSDLYMNLDDGHVPSRFRPSMAGRSSVLVVPESYNFDLAEIRRLVNADFAESGTITFKNLRLRFARFQAAEGERWAVMRANSLDLPSLTNLGIASAFIEEVRSWGQKRGLVVIGGRMGNGKTTTAVAAIQDYLTRLGGFAYTVEDPVEYQLQGAISAQGFCLQNDVVDDDWAPAMRRAMRTRPNYLFVGEIRTPEAAAHLLKAATSGCLVITTTHGGSVADTVSGILQLAEDEMGVRARSILGDRLIAAVYQELGSRGPSIKALSIRTDDERKQLCAQLEKGQTSQLKSNGNWSPVARSN